MMKKLVFVFTIVLLLTFMFVMTVSATPPEYVEGYVPLLSVGSDGVDFWYEVCDPYLVGKVVQPAVTPGMAVHGTFTAGNSDFGCGYTTELSGTCEITLVPVEEFGDPDSKPGRGVLGNCTDDLEGYHAVLVIDEWYGYQAWYHIDP